MVIGLPCPKSQLSNGITDKNLIDELIKKDQYRKKCYIYELHYISQIIENTTQCKIIKYDNMKVYSIYSDSEMNKKKLCRLTIGRNYGNYFINIELNPSKLNQHDCDELEGLFSILFDHHYAEIYQRGVVSHFEFFVDVVNVDPNDLLLIDKGRRKTTVHKGTIYHGSRRSKLVCTMYDKGAQQGMNSSITRIEARINQRNLRFIDLIENGIPNPFENLFVVSADSVQLIAQDYKQPQFAQLLRELGVYGITPGNPAARKKILERLKEYTVPWWKPELIWEVHREMLQEFKPPFMGGSLHETNSSL
ncbi:hypothetical protein R2103_04990 [Nitrosomonas sp. Is24]|uniref:hypothetical protein n=1 Tax=Nitrosomonas sp. Is24 TaxID=3080533 RepID=UPI00294B2B4E|nr:hypothetical protein [Nitrosomonas sp. Is24]MDV6341123.1 hypothetical protein [Nitrosomonas sp. Is24]